MLKAHRPPEHLSHSQLTTWIECGERYRLERIFKLSGFSWWSTIFGSAMHAMTEAFDAGQKVVPSDWPYYFDAAEQLERITSDSEPRSSGPKRETVCWSGGPDKRDRGWCLIMGPPVFEAYLRWRKDSGLLPFAFNNIPAIELEFNVKVADVQVRGFVDRLFLDPHTGQLIVVDIKTGARGPSSMLQLMIYKVALLKQYDIAVDAGMFLSPRHPRGGVLHWGGTIENFIPDTEEFIAHLFHSARRGIDAGIFMPNTASCHVCGVSDWCRIQKGLLSWEVPIREEFDDRRDHGHDQVG